MLDSLARRTQAGVEGPAHAQGACEEGRGVQEQSQGFVATLLRYSPNVWTTALGIWLLVAGIVGFFTMAYDKSAAGYGGGRVREKTLWNIAFIGGAWGMTAAEYLLHHKNNKFEFMASIYGSAAGWFLLLLTVEGNPWWTHLLNHC
jgi:uncharacterized membrane protein YsdA (DUF1294 family)